MTNIRWYGRGGQGAFTAARLLGEIVSVYGGKYALAYPSFGPERRGAPVWSFTKIDDAKIVDRSQPAKCSYLAVLDETLIKENIDDYLDDDGILIVNTVKPEAYSFVQHKLIALNATQMALKILGRPITNVAMLGAVAGISGMFPLENAEIVLSKHFKGSLLEKNKQLMHEAYNAVKGGK